MNKEVSSESPTIYYPYYLSVWIVHYRSIFGNRSEKVTVMSDMVRGGSSFANLHPTEEIKVKDLQCMEGKFSKEVTESDASEMLRRFYLHKARSWKVPKIEKSDSIFVHIPYQIVEKKALLTKKKKVYLYEPMSEQLDLLNKFPEIENHLVKEGLV